MKNSNNEFYKIIGKKIRELRNKRNMSLERLGEHIGKSKKTVQRYEMGEHKIPIETMKMITDALNYNWEDFQDFMNNEFNKYFKGLLDEAEEVNEDGSYLVSEKHHSYSTNSNLIKIYGRICAGNGITAFEDIIDEIICPWARANGEMIGLQVDGESMNQVVKNGDYAIIKMQPDVENGQVAAVIIDNENAILKRLYKVDEETVMLKPESTENYEPLIFMKEEINKIRIIGKFIGYVSPYVD